MITSVANAFIAQCQRGGSGSGSGSGSGGNGGHGGSGGGGGRDAAAAAGGGTCDPMAMEAFGSGALISSN